MRLPPAAVVGIFVAVDCPGSGGVTVGARLSCFPVSCYVSSGTQHFDFCERKDAPLARQFNADESRRTRSHTGLGLLRGDSIRPQLSIYPRCLRFPRLGCPVSSVVVRWYRAFPALIHFRFDPASMSAAIKSIRLEGTDKRNVEVRFDRILQADRPKTAVDDHSPIA